MSVAAGRKWDDLTVRIATAVVLAVVCLVPVYLGGTPLKILTAVLAGVMIWELLVMLVPERALLPAMLGYLTMAAVYLFGDIGAAASVGLLVSVPFLGFALAPRNRILILAYSCIILGGAIGIFVLRQDLGLTWVLWLLLVVVASDMGGYFAGRLFGGPKFWPSVSPKKTWSGVLGGWVLAGVVGAVFMGPTNSGAGLVVASVFLALASQLGDIAESAIKRHAGVKDSSHLLPGHGGFLDRFDGLLPVACLWLLYQVTSGNVPGLY